MEYIDLRSDTVTHPTKEMRESMMLALLGDDVYGDDLVTNELQQYAAELLNKEASLLVPSGCFGNICSIYTVTQPGDEVICDHNAHIVDYEGGSSAIISGVQFRCIDTSNTDGLMQIRSIDKYIRKVQNMVYPKTKIIEVEQPTFRGKVYSLDTLRQIYQLAKQYNIHVHMDGARVFNAATYLKCEVKEITQYCDSIMFCLSKGLCAPIGSMIVGTKEFITKALATRKMMGGGMCQTGLLAAPGLLALKTMIPQIEKDHEIMQTLVKSLSSLPNIEILNEPQINMVFFRINKTHCSNHLIQIMLEQKIKFAPSSDGVYRVMTHHYIREAQIQKFIDTLQEFLSLE